MMVFRLVIIPQLLDKENFDQELKLLTQIAKFNGYEKDLILKMVGKHEWFKEFKTAGTINNGLENEIIKSAMIYYPKISFIINTFKTY